MPSLLKTLLALMLAIGFLALDARAQDPAADPAAAPVAAAPRPTLAFLGLDADSDPLAAKTISGSIRRELELDSALQSFPESRIEPAFGKGLLPKPAAGPADVYPLSRVVGARYYAFGRLERISVTSKRTWWMPWSIKVQWEQGVTLRVIDSASGEPIFDGRVDAAVPEKAFLTGPEKEWGRMAPLEREKRLRIMAAAVSGLSAKAVAKAVKDKAAPVDASANDAAAAPPG